MLQLGIIGCGKVTTMFHLKAISEVDEIGVAAVADPDSRRMLEVKKKAGAKRGYLDTLKLLKDDEVDVVAINTPPSFHKEYTLEAISAGKHALVEKPLAKNVEGLKQIQETLKGSGLFIIPVHNYAFTPCLKLARKIIMAGEIGDLSKMEVWFNNNLWSYGAKTSFRMDESFAIIEDLFPHILSTIQTTIMPVNRVTTVEGWKQKYSVIDNLKVELEAGNGIPISCEMNWTSLIPAFRVRFLGEVGNIDLEMMKSPYSISIKTKRGRRKIRERGLGWLLDLARMKHPAFEEQYRHLVRVIQGEESPRFTVEDESRMLELIKDMKSILFETTNVFNRYEVNGNF